MKANFKCPRCKKLTTVGKRLSAKYTCPHCKNQILVRSHEREQGHVDYKKNFMIQR